MAGAESGYQARWEEHNSAREMMILRAAVDLLEETPSGTHVSVQQIAKRAGLAKSVVYRRFGDRDDLDRRIRSYLVDDFAGTMAAKLDISHGSVKEILGRSIDTVAGWMSEHPRLHDFMGQGPTQDDDSGADAVSILRGRIAGRAREIITVLLASFDIDDSGLESLPLAIVTMVEGMLTQWVRDPAQGRSRAEVVADLTAYTWFMLDGAARSLGLVIDPTTELRTVVERMTGAEVVNGVTV
ncbi:TetR family transcriptional regulator [Actinomadura bangladeshensis]|jgi:AcrR family transcriptional regulator|uniref:Helix-turn-helix transcriptional regulator n=1 Tax=Actinomadura bangladeshensis TaxID=453573 RepID=A0A6L9QSF1_9ACTN|nr:TetR family transcriptional regulator [Actinomadura bangladeshensis]NEA26894.1 helix-turn-helix transcriptional regulator [Actinomadura bangladeshensis]